MRIFIGNTSGPCAVLGSDGIPFWLHVLEAQLRHA